MRSSWLISLAYEARVRHAADRRRDEVTAARLAAMHTRILASLRCAVAFDIEAFLEADADRDGVTVTCHNGSSAQGFVVSRTDDGIGRRHLNVDLTAGTLSCRYETRGDAINGATDHHVSAIEIAQSGSALSLWNGGRVRTFATVDALSAFLLAPILGA